MEQYLTALENLSDQHEKPGRELFNACNGELLPCDTLAFAVLERSLNLLKGFNLLLSHGGYTSGVGLLRMQLDNVLRLHGVVTSADPHGVANQLFHGTQLRTLQDRFGVKMTDAGLVELLAAKNPSIASAYKLACSYIHLSDQHILHFLKRSKKNFEGKRVFAIGDEDEHVEPEHKSELINAFAVVTRGVLELVNQWVSTRDGCGTTEQLKERFASAI